MADGPPVVRESLCFGKYAIPFTEETMCDHEGNFHEVGTSSIETTPPKTETKLKNTHEVPLVDISRLGGGCELHK